MGLLIDVWISISSFKKILEVHSMFTINYLILYFRTHLKTIEANFLKRCSQLYMEYLCLNVVKMRIKG
jgi:hypothetical protein